MPLKKVIQIDNANALQLAVQHLRVRQTRATVIRRDHEFLHPLRSNIVRQRNRKIDPAPRFDLRDLVAGTRHETKNIDAMAVRRAPQTRNLGSPRAATQHQYPARQTCLGRIKINKAARGDPDQGAQKRQRQQIPLELLSRDQRAEYPQHHEPKQESNGNPQQGLEGRIALVALIQPGCEHAAEDRNRKQGRLRQQFRPVRYGLNLKSLKRRNQGRHKNRHQEHAQLGAEKHQTRPWKIMAKDPIHTAPLFL